MGRLRGRIRNLERAADEELVVVEHEDGTTSKFREGEIMECFMHEMDRGRRHHNGEEPGPAHPFMVALRTATNLDALTGTEGLFLANLLGEDEIMRGLRERPGPKVRETSPGVYE